MTRELTFLGVPVMVRDDGFDTAPPSPLPSPVESGVRMWFY